MSKGLEALNHIKQIEIAESVLCGDGKIKQVFIEAQNHEDYKEDYDTIEKELKEKEELQKLLEHERELNDHLILHEVKALEIIKEKQVDVSCLLFDGLELYNENMHPSRVLTQEEYDLLKEVLL